MSKHKGAEQRGKAAPQQGQAASQSRDARKPQETGAHDRGAAQDRQQDVRKS